VRRCSGVGIRLTGDAGLGVHRLVGEPVCVRVAGPRHPGVCDITELAGQLSRLAGQRSPSLYDRCCGVPSPPRSARTTCPSSSVSVSAAARRVVPDAEQYICVPYVYGGNSPSGFDCSGLVQYVYAKEGVDLPRTSRQMAGSGIAVSPTAAAMAVGDLMLFTQGGQISHVAIYAGSGRFIHSSSSGHGVRYDDLNTQRGQWFADHLVAVRRVAGGSGAAVVAFARSLIPFDHFDPPDSAPPVRNK